MPHHHFSLHFEVFCLEAFISNSVLFSVYNTKQNISVIFNLVSVPIPREERKLSVSVTPLMRSKTDYWNIGGERVGVVQGSLCISLISDGANIMKNCTACCKQITDQNSFMLLIFLSWSYFPLIFVIIRVRWTPSRLYGMLPIFIALNKINCSNELCFNGNSFSIFLYLYFYCSSFQTKWNNEQIKMSDEFSEMPTSKSLCQSHCQGQLNFFVLTNSHNAVNNYKSRRRPGCSFRPSSQKSAHLPV